MYIRYFGKGKHPTTIVGIYENENETVDRRRTLKIGFSICSPKDIFRKKVGHTSALKMAIWYPWFKLNVNGRRDAYKRFESFSEILKRSVKSTDIRFLTDWKHELKQGAEAKKDEVITGETNISV